MKSLLKVSNINTNEDIINVREAIAQNAGVIACEVSLSKKEVNIVYDDKSVTIDKIISSIEEIGYSII
ncbi:ferredoxin [Clostridium perfringens]|jgi:copper chaperone|uniref:Ferredoxin n=1 Tax=Clostridium perfringens TaxID=1502 RepID=A0AAW9I999_CLOPF|nr:heavy-metal-associated domain-containing protein [Clostridium perfringens]MDZ5000579.1 ferredoxin [Clostridium perfringens]